MLLLHVAEGIEVYNVRVMEEQIILRCQLNFHLLNHVVLMCALQEQHFHADCFEGAHFLRAVFRVVDTELEGCRTVKQNGVAFLEGGVEFVDGREIEVVEAGFLGLLHFLLLFEL